MGIPWLGWVVYPDRLRLKRRNAVNFSRRLAHLLGLYHEGEISFAELDASVKGWIAHVAFGDTWGLRRHIFNAHHILPKNAAEPACALRAIQTAER